MCLPKFIVMKEIALIDIGAGNLHSVYKAFKYIGANIEITNAPNTIESSPRIIFPGVGAFGAVVNQIKKNNLEQAIVKAINAGKPFFGICLGMQVLFESSEESPGVRGLGVFKGKVVAGSFLNPLTLESSSSDLKSPCFLR